MAQFGFGCFNTPNNFNLCCANQLVGAGLNASQITTQPYACTMLTGRGSGSGTIGTNTLGSLCAEAQGYGFPNQAGTTFKYCGINACANGNILGSATHVNFACNPNYTAKSYCGIVPERHCAFNYCAVTSPYLTGGVCADAAGYGVTNANAAQGSVSQNPGMLYNSIGANAAQGNVAQGSQYNATLGTAAQGNVAQGSQYCAAQAKAAGSNFNNLCCVQVQNQFSNLTKGVTCGQVPDWARTAVTAARQQMTGMGLGNSTMAGSAMEGAILNTALPMAQQNAQEAANINAQNVGNQQQTALQNAQFTNASRQYNAQVVAALNSQNLNNIQQMNIQNAQALNAASQYNASVVANLNSQNLSNAQQANMATAQYANAAAQYNAQTQANLYSQNLSNQQQANLFNAQQANLQAQYHAATFAQMNLQNLLDKQQTLLSNTAAQNAAAQFRAQNDTQNYQFFSSLISNISQQNANRQTAVSQFNAGQQNAMLQFNANQSVQTQEFNSQNQLLVDQSNVQWRRAVNTANTAGLNAANQANVQNQFNLSTSAQNAIWQQARDEASYSVTSGENSQNRLLSLVNSALNRQTSLQILTSQLKAQTNAQLGALAGNLLGSVFGGSGGIGGLFKGLTGGNGGCCGQVIGGSVNPGTPNNSGCSCGIGQIGGCFGGGCDLFG